MSWTQILNDYFQSNELEFDLSTLEISKPLYSGIKNKLVPHSNNNEDLINPYFVGEIENAVGYHLGMCRELREQAFDLQDRFTDLIDNLVLQNAIRDAQLASLDIQQQYADKLLATRSVLKVSPTTISAEGNDATAKKYVGKNTDVQRELLNTATLHEKETLEKLSLQGIGAGLIARFNETKAHFLEETLKAYRLSKTLYKGLKHVYKIDIPLPEIADDNYLTELLFWHSNISTLFHHKQTQIKPVNWSLSSYNASSGIKSLYTSAVEFQADRGAGEFSFTLDNTHFEQLRAHYNNIVMRGIALHATTSAANDVPGFKAVIRILNDNDHLSPFSPIIVNNIPRVTHEFELLFDGRDSVFNRNPLGDWHIKVTPKDLDGSDLNDDAALKDLIVSFQLAVWN